ncbi:ADP-ribose pyrophosphatase YjhB (NUDIX family) [Roseibium hamelinense]|uniref:ADP-ribose pyrophosphatase YjhB (NUDIX family) n=1 Tax=Roseibium hamelinense TaxID=150831 RepID=A0A562T3W7_9HYPH|nr:NUDIX hydrolase [Roseibium hamelinense]MTI42279.1 NUDIX domain-containing protein [Roseibium hamelinense]TWI87700.1 ADP-ribose pyrophosphatase YjhB (NUDIX family) [Roseibium hamelinense]
MTSEVASRKGPIVGVSVLCHDQDRVLLIKRGNPPYKGLWSLPGGRVEYGEALTAAAERELFEETGIKATLGEPVDMFETMMHDGAGTTTSHYVLVVFSGAYLSGTPWAGDDAADASWFAIGELGSLHTTPGTVARIKRLLPGR